MAKDQKVLKDDELDRQLTDKGFAIFPMLTPEEVADLRQFFLTENEIPEDGFYASSHHPDSALRAKTNEKILSVFKKYVDHYFDGCISLGGTFLSKGKGIRGKLDPHQDWNILEEDKFRAFNVWVPLVNVTPENGCIYLVEKSHQIKPTIRGANIPSFFAPSLSTIWELATPVPMKAGEALVYDLRVLHASPVNESDHLRLAIVFGVKPEGSEMRYYYKEGDTIGKYASDVEFYMTKNIFMGPDGLKKLDTIPYDSVQMEGDEFRAWHREAVLGLPPEIKKPVSEPEKPVAAKETTVAEVVQPETKYQGGFFGWFKKIWSN